MKTRFLLIVLAVLIEEVLNLSHPDRNKFSSDSFCYDANESCGPESWEGTCQTGTRQSPIDINAKKYKIFKKLTDFGLNRQYRAAHSSYFARNNGHSLYIQFDTSMSPTSTLEFHEPTLKRTYRFAQLHFHWGSEHTVNGVRYPLELHAVHYSTTYDSYMEAANAEGDPNAIRVLAVLYQVDKHNPALDPIIRAAEASSHEQDEFRKFFSYISLQDLLPFQLDFIQYRGSLTTPPCTENVVWTIFMNPIPISQQQLDVFQRLLNAEEKLYTNYRPTQALNGRRIERFVVPALRRSLVSVAKQEFQNVVPSFGSLIIRVLAGIWRWFHFQLSANVAFWSKFLG